MESKRPWWKQDDPRILKMKNWLSILRILAGACGLLAVVIYATGTHLFFEKGIIIVWLLILAALLLAVISHSFKLIVAYIMERIENE